MTVTSHEYWHSHGARRTRTRDLTRLEKPRRRCSTSLLLARRQAPGENHWPHAESPSTVTVTVRLGVCQQVTVRLGVCQQAAACHAARDCQLSGTTAPAAGTRTRPPGRSDAAVTGPSRRVKTGPGRLNLKYSLAGHWHRTVPVSVTALPDSEYCMITPPALRPPRRRHVTVAVPGPGGSGRWQ